MRDDATRSASWRPPLPGLPDLWLDLWLAGRALRTAWLADLGERTERTMRSPAFLRLMSRGLGGLALFSSHTHRTER